MMREKEASVGPYSLNSPRNHDEDGDDGAQGDYELIIYKLGIRFTKYEYENLL